MSTRSELVRALFPDAEIASDGTFTSAAGADATPKIVVIRGALDASVDGEERPLSADMWREPGDDFAPYVEAYKPSVVERRSCELECCFEELSYSHFMNQDKTLLPGSSDSGTAANGFGALSVTVHHNYFDGAGQRLPQVRFGKVHVYDNVYAGTLGYLGQYAPRMARWCRAIASSMALSGFQASITLADGERK